MTLSEELKNHLNDIYNKCLHCGLCLPTCPTYNLTFREESSPRGRIQLIHSVQNNNLTMSEKFVDEMYFCLDCQACESACPAGVHYGELLEETRNQISENNREPFRLRIFKKIFLKWILSNPRVTKLAAKCLRLYQKCGLKDAVDQSEILRMISEILHEKHKLLPTINDTFFDESVDEVIPSVGETRGRVAFLSGCIMNVAFADVHRDAIEVLTKNGYEVIIPKKQVCCGSLHAHNGELSRAKVLARKNIEVFEKFQFDTLIVDSAGCGAFMKEYSHIFAGDDLYAERAVQFSRKVKDISELLSEVKLTKQHCHLKKRITYHEACHLIHTQKISQQPRELITSIPGVEFAELPEATWCCGSAGIYNVVRYEDSMKVLERKINNLKSTGAEIVVTANPGCYLQLQYGIKKFELNMEVVHPVTLIARAYKSNIS